MMQFGTSELCNVLYNIAYEDEMILAYPPHKPGYKMQASSDTLAGSPLPLFPPRHVRSFP